MTGSDGELWCTIKPLMADIQNAMEDMTEIDSGKLNQEDYYIFQMKLLGLKTVYEFLGALQTEQFLKDEQKKMSGIVNISGVLQ